MLFYIRKIFKDNISLGFISFANLLSFVIIVANLNASYLNLILHPEAFFYLWTSE